MTAFLKIIKNLIFLLTLLATSAAVFAAQNETTKRELVILNWSEYMDPDLVKKFEDKNNVKVKSIYFESDDYRDNYMLETQGKGIDIIVINGAKIGNYVKQKWVVPLTEKEVPNLKHIDKKWLSMFKLSEGYVIPYFWGTTGIAYLKDLVKKKITSWNDILNPDESLRGKISMIGAHRDLIGVALLALGYSINSTSFTELKKAKELLLKQKPYVGDYDYISLDETSTMVKGDVHISMGYSGDILQLREHDKNIEYVVPKEGTALWVDYMVVGSSSVNNDIAFQFINFLNQPSNAAKQAEWVRYATPNTAAEKLLPAEFLSDSLIYPPKEVLDKSEIYKELPPRGRDTEMKYFLVSYNNTTSC